MRAAAYGCNVFLYSTWNVPLPAKMVVVVGGTGHRRLILKMTPFFVRLQKSQCFKTASIQKSQKNKYENILSSVKMAVMAVMLLFALILRGFIFSSMWMHLFYHAKSRQKTVSGYFWPNISAARLILEWISFQSVQCSEHYLPLTGHQTAVQTSDMWETLADRLLHSWSRATGRFPITSALFYLTVPERGGTQRV